MTVMICTGTKEDGTPCKKPYVLPVPYQDANPVIRDLCPECIHQLQREHEEGRPAPKKEQPKEDWFS